MVANSEFHEGVERGDVKSTGALADTVGAEAGAEDEMSGGGYR